MEGHGVGNGGSSSLREPQREKSQALADSLYDGPLDHIIRNHPELFVRPSRWTARHAGYLQVSYMEEEPWMSSFTPLEHELEHEDSVRSTGVSKPEANKSQDMLRVSSFSLPDITYLRRDSHISRLSTHNTATTRLIAMQGLLVGKNSKALEGYGPIANPFYPSRNRESNNNKKEIQNRLRVKSIPLSITYSKRKIVIVPNSRTYTLAKDTPNEPMHHWRLIYLDQSQLKDRRSLKWKKRRRTMADELGVENTTAEKGDLDEWSPNKGHMASLFIAMAQQLQCEIEEKQTQRSATCEKEPSHIRSNIERPEPQQQARYQILLTDNNGDSPYIYLYTAQVSDFLLEHFRTPAHLPEIARLERNSPLLKIHRTIIPFSPWKSFRRRLRTGIMNFANGTAGGFFSDQPTG
ncbi:hypothetical protein EKO27_g923 [Xylaria grammica]|uniref:Uncharacterized protein n=1 Tax=Xylaria grammica TaxID=363999 RepID=A0A439DIH2_9PEZI|nr:hypothetical protein EKO27_g923 [Xylaria grammica]